MSWKSLHRKVREVWAFQQRYHRDIACVGGTVLGFHALRKARDVCIWQCHFRANAAINVVCHFHSPVGQALVPLVHNNSNLLQDQFQTTSLIVGHTVDGRNPAPVEVGSLTHYLQGFLHPRWLFEISEPSIVWLINRFWRG